MNCPICGLEIEPEIINEHLDICLEEVDISNTKYHNYIEPTLTLSQKNALTYSQKKALIHSKQTKGLVLTRFIKLGHDENDLNIVLNYIQSESKVTINCPTKILTEHIINSSHFKNRYETVDKSCYLNSRTAWEDNLFNNSYSKSEPIEKPKYGALNLLKLVGGSAVGYGKSYFVVKPCVKNRITFVNGDSSLKMFHICTFDYPVALLIHLSDKHLSDIIDIAKGKIITNVHHNYIECQIHGLLRINMDFEKLYLCENECTLYEINNVKEFCNLNSIEYFCL